MTNTNEETKFSTSLPIYKINSNYKYEKTHTQGPWFQLTAQFDSKAEDLEAIGRDTTQAIEYENGRVWTVTTL